VFDAASVRRVDAASSWRNFFRRPPVWAQRMDATVVPEDLDARPLCSSLRIRKNTGSALSKCDPSLAGTNPLIA
jgi:hypothetical protein